MADSLTTSPAAATVETGKIDREEAALEEAFSDSPNSMSQEAPDLRLRDVVPPPKPVAFDELEKESTVHRVLYLQRGAVIAVTTIVSIGGALFIHSLLGGIFVLGVLLGFSAPHDNGHGGDSMSEGGASPEGYMVMGDASAPEMGGALASLSTPDASLPALSPPIPLPSLPEVTAMEVAIQQLQAPAATVTAPMVSDLGTVKVRLPAHITEPGALAFASKGQAMPDPGQSQERVSPLFKNGGAGNALAVSPPSALQKTSKAGNGAGSLSRGQVPSDTDDGEERVFSLFKGDGKGKGSGGGHGIDRGFSAANSEAQPLGLPSIALPLQYQLKPPGRSIKIEITVLADGTVGDIRLAQSCGIKDLDDSLIVLAKTSFRFRPAFRAGKAVQSVFEFEQSF